MVVPSLPRLLPRTRLIGVAVGALLLAPATASAALTDSSGRVVPGTDWSSPAAQLLEPPSCVEPGTAPRCERLAEPGSPDDDSADARAALASSGAPEDDLHEALDALAAAADAASAIRARDEALAILEGRPLPGRAYSGIPLLNWNAPAKVKAVPAGGEVTVTQVRTPAHTLSDAWLLSFEDPDQPYTVRYRLSELGGTFGGQLQPVPLLAEGDRPLGGVPAALVPLSTPSLATGTSDWSRFTRERGIPAPGAAEATRLGVSEVVVRMPPPGVTSAVLHPSHGAHGPSLHTLAPASNRRLARAQAAAGFSGGSPTAAERRAAIERLAAAAPERQLWSDLLALPAEEDPGFLAAARAAGEQDRALVGAMRTRDALPDGVLPDPDADVTVVLQNNEAYVSRGRVRPGADLRVQVVNRDRFEHSFAMTALDDRRQVLGAEDWGHFDWAALGEATSVPAGGSLTIERTLNDGVFAAALGDPDSGDQAMAIVELDRGPLTESTTLGDSDSAAPLHSAVSADGGLWVTLTGSDQVVRLQRGSNLASAPRTTVLMPGGAHTVTSERPPLEPADVAVDERGIVWVTLVLGNAIARIDPAQVSDGSDAGVRLYPLAPCGDDECAVPFVPAPGERPSREPLQMEVTSDASGNTVVWFTEAAAGRIGALRVDPAGRPLDQAGFSCGCDTPLGLALDEAGDVWFTEAVENRLGRLTPGLTEPFSAGAARLRHYVIPSAVRTVEPDISRVELLTSLPHSVAVDARGLVWATESATGKLAVLDPAAARPGTSAGFTEIDLPHNDFKGAPVPADLAIDRAGTVFWADEYGDAVGVVDATRGPASSWRAGRSLRPVERRSLTDSPLVSPEGDLWFVESGANRLVRVAGVSAGAPAPGPAALIELDTGSEGLAATGLREVDALDVVVERVGREVARATGVAVAGGSARIASRDWSGDPDALRAGDVIRITRRGAHARAVLEHTLPALGARAASDGSVTGSARRMGEALPGRVIFDGDRSAAIAASDGTFKLPPAGGPAPREVAWTASTPGARYRTTAPVAPAPIADPQPPAPAQQAPPVADAPGAAAPAPAPPATVPGSSAVPTCPGREWLTGSARRPRPAFLGMEASTVRECLGAPARRRASGRRVWTYTAGLTLELSDDRVVRMTISGRKWTSARGGLRVGASARSVRAALPVTAADGRRGRRAVLALDAAGAADVRIALTRDGRRVARIDVRLAARAALDRAGRRLLERRA